jgi:alanine dehydrogenase
MAILLREADVEHLVTMKMALEAVEQCFRLQGENRTDNAPRRRSRLGTGFLHVMSASLPSLGLAGLKSYTSIAGKTRFHVLLYSAQEGGELVAVIEADRLGQMRTGAASGIATKFMSRPDSSRVGIFGTGWQARAQIMAACAVRPIKTVIAYGRDAERKEKFCKEMTDILNIGVYPAATEEEAVKDMDIVITATNSKEPVFRGDWLAKGAHINAIGSNHLSRHEIDVTTVRRSACVLVDSVEQAKMECGDLAKAAEAGAFYWEDARELGLVVTGEYPGREDAGEITLFESQGVALEDVALAGKIYQAAVKAKVGENLPL